MKIESKIYQQKTTLELFTASNTPTRAKYYFNNDFSFLDSTNSVSLSLEVESELPQLQIKDSKTDAKNAVSIYNSLGPLSIDFSLDPRFWIYLTHNQYQQYTYSRWLKGKNTAGTIGDRFFGFYKISTDRALARNAISRLWWGARLTVKDGNPDLDYFFTKGAPKYKYTELLFSSQDVFQQLTERTLSRNKKIILSILFFMNQSNIAFSKHNIVFICKSICLHMYNNKLGMLSAPQIVETLSRIINTDELVSEN